MFFFKRKEKKKQVSGFILPRNQQKVSSPKDYEKFSKETYMRNIIAFRCIDYRAKSFSAVPWNVYNNSTKEKNENHNFNNIFTYANINDGWGFYVYKELSYRLISGNSYTQGISLGGKIDANSIKELHILRPDKMKIIKNNDDILLGYSYHKNPNKEPIIFEVDPITGESEIMQVKLFHPLDDFYGLAPTEPASYDIDSSNEATKWNFNIMQNEGRPGMVITVDGQLTEEQYERLKEQLNSMYEGSKNAGRSLILDGMSVDAKPYNWSPKEMDWLESNREMSRRICIAYGVPPLLINIPGDSTYNNYKEARTAFWEDTVIPDLNLYKSELNNWLFRNDVNFANYDLSKIPAFSEKQEQLWERAEKSTFLTINEKREMVNLDPVSDGDIVLVSGNMLPLGFEKDIPNSVDDQAKKEISNLKKLGYTEEQSQIMLGLK